jgi:hypothetical protein
MLRLNPFLDEKSIQTMLNLVSVGMLRANRLGHVNRCIGAVIGLDALLQKVLSLKHDQKLPQGSVLAPKLIQAGEDLSKNITMARHYMTPLGNGQYSFDPRYLVFEFVWNIQLRKKQVRS